MKEFKKIWDCKNKEVEPMMFSGQRRVECEEITDECTINAGVRLFVARFDKIHPVVSGNKLYKLRYFLQQALEQNKPVVTFGGPFSNHLSAAAYACKILEIPCVGVINGEHHPLTHTLKQCNDDGMQLSYVSPLVYRSLKLCTSQDLFPNAILIPEGGYHPLGAKGAALMPEEISWINATHTCLSVGTATTLAGFLSGGNSEIIAVPAIKNMTDIPDRLEFLQINYNPDKLKIWNEYHFGGFAKMTSELQEFMHNFNNRFKIELDRVYTSKMIYGVLNKISDNYFPPGSRVVCIHSGGLQGNK